MLWNTQQRTLQQVPRMVRYAVLAFVGLQLVWQTAQHAQTEKLQSLNPPPKIGLVQLMSFGDKVAAAKLLMLWVQSFDNQAGKILSYHQLDYHALQMWLERILELDPRSQYPLLAASYIYANVTDAVKKRQMLDFVYQAFLQDPVHRWSWLAHVTVTAKHRLHDLPLALKYAKALNSHPSPDMPHHIREMQVFILEEMGELEQARLLIGGLLMQGKIHDPHEIRFLNERLQELEQQTLIP